MLQRRQIFQAAVRPDLIVMLPPLLDHDNCFNPVSEPLHVQAFVSEFAIEALVCAILPRLSRIAQGHLDALASRPFQQCVRYELRAIIGSKIARLPVQRDQPLQHIDHAP